MKHTKLLAFLAVLFLFSPFWAPHVQHVGGRNLFIAGNAFTLIGITLLAALIGRWLVPQAVVTATEKGLYFVQRHLLPFALFFLALLFVGLYAVNRFILHSFMGSGDEHSCYFLAECLRMGKWYMAPHPLPEFFQVVHVGNRGGKWFSVYPPGWPLILALGLKFQIQDWLNPALTTLSFVFFYKAGKKVFGSISTWVGLLFLATAPFFIFTSAAYFSHGLCLLLLSIFLYAYLKWRETPENFKGVLWALLAALMVGYGLGTRYLTTAAIAGPFLIYHYLPVLLRRRKLVASDWVFGGVVFIFLVLVFSHNYLITGKPFNAPNHYDKRWERLGFRSDYTILDGLIYLLARFFYLADWFAPTLVALFLIFTFQKRAFSAEQNLFRFAFFYPAFAYFFYYSWGGNQFGPRYYYEGLPFLVMAVGAGLAHWWRGGTGEFRKFLLVLIVASIGTGGYLFYRQADFYREAYGQRKALYELAEKSIQKPAIVFIHGFLGKRLVMAEEDAARNHPALNTKILYAHDLGEKNQVLKKYYPDREYYRGTYDPDLKKAKLERL